MLGSYTAPYALSWRHLLDLGCSDKHTEGDNNHPGFTLTFQGNLGVNKQLCNPSTRWDTTEAVR